MRKDIDLWDDLGTIANPIGPSNMAAADPRLDRGGVFKLRMMDLARSVALFIATGIVVWKEQPWNYLIPALIVYAIVGAFELSSVYGAQGK